MKNNNENTEITMIDSPTTWRVPAGGVRKIEKERVYIPSKGRELRSTKIMHITPEAIY